MFLVKVFQPGRFIIAFLRSVLTYDFTALLAWGFCCVIILAIHGRMVLCQGSDTELEGRESGGGNRSILEVVGGNVDQERECSGVSLFRLLDSRRLGHRPPISTLIERLTKRNATVEQWTTQDENTRIVMDACWNDIQRFSLLEKGKDSIVEIFQPFFLEEKLRWFECLPIAEEKASRIFRQVMRQTLGSFRQELDDLMFLLDLESEEGIVRFPVNQPLFERRACTDVFLRHTNMLSIHIEQLRKELRF